MIAWRVVAWKAGRQAGRPCQTSKRPPSLRPNLSGRDPVYLERGHGTRPGMLVPRRNAGGADNGAAVGWANEHISSELPAAATAQSKRSSKRGCPGDRLLIRRSHPAGPGATGLTRAGERALEFAVGGSEKDVRFHCGEQQYCWDFLPERFWRTFRALWEGPIEEKWFVSDAETNTM